MLPNRVSGKRENASIDSTLLEHSASDSQKKQTMWSRQGTESAVPRVNRKWNRFAGSSRLRSERNLKEVSDAVALSSEEC